MQADDDALRRPLLAASEVTDDPHVRCRFANDVRLDRASVADRLTWPCGLTVIVSPPRRRYFLPELNDLHDEARRVRATETRRRSETARKVNRNRRRRPGTVVRETDDGPAARNTVDGP